MVKKKRLRRPPEPPRPPAIVHEAAAKVGGMSALARHLGIRHNAFYRWKAVPPNRVIPIEKATGIHRSYLRPDLYPEEA